VAGDYYWKSAVAAALPAKAGFHLHAQQALAVLDEIS